jgi:hypothetical protein
LRPAPFVFRTGTRRLGTLIASLAALACAAPSGAQESAPRRELFPDQAAAPLPKPGEPVILYGKYKGLVGDELQILDRDFRFRLSDPKLVDAFLDLHAEKDNLALHGRFVKAPDDPPEAASGAPRPVFEVEAVHPAPGDEDLFTTRLRTLVQSNVKDRDTFLGIGKALHRLEEFGDAEKLGALKTRAVFEAFRLGEEGLDPKDTPARLKLIAEFRQRIPDDSLEVELLKHLDRLDPNHRDVAQRMRGLGFRKVNGQWLDQQQFRAQKGFVLFKDHWVKTNDREFYELIESLSAENLTGLILRSKTDRAYAQLASAGKVDRGMNFEEVAKALGFPDRVRRQQFRQLEVDQWDFGDQRIYFLNDQVYALRAAGDGETSAGSK